MSKTTKEAFKHFFAANETFLLRSHGLINEDHFWVIRVGKNIKAAIEMLKEDPQTWGLDLDKHARSISPQREIAVCGVLGGSNHSSFSYVIEMTAMVDLEAIIARFFAEQGDLSVATAQNNLELY